MPPCFLAPSLLSSLLPSFFHFPSIFLSLSFPLIIPTVFLSPRLNFSFFTFLTNFAPFLLRCLLYFSPPFFSVSSHPSSHLCFLPTRFISFLFLFLVTFLSIFVFQVSIYCPPFPLFANVLIPTLHCFFIFPLFLFFILFPSLAVSFPFFPSFLNLSFHFRSASSSVVPSCAFSSSFVSFHSYLFPLLSSFLSLLLNL